MQLLKHDGLREQGISAKHRDLIGGLGGDSAADDDDWQLGVETLCSFQDLTSAPRAHAIEMQVGDDQRKIGIAQQTCCFIHASCGLSTITSFGQEIGEQKTDFRYIIDDKDILTADRIRFVHS